MTGTDEPAAVAEFDSMAYQTALSSALAGIRTVLQRRQLDPLRYRVDIDAGLPVFAARTTHQLRIGYNRFDELSMEVTVPHEWLMIQTGKAHDQFLLAVDDMVLALKSKVLATGKPL